MKKDYISSLELAKENIHRHYFDELPIETRKILFVTDDDGSYSPNHRFGLTELIKTLETTTDFFVNFRVTKAHRGINTQYSITADSGMEGFRFTNLSKIEEYDQIWFFGVLSLTTDPNSPNTTMTESELEIVARFMDGGGGVFATGDHEDLGQPLCGQIPRVRSMRKWDFPKNIRGKFDPDNPDKYAPEFTEDSAYGIPVIGYYRHDTLTPTPEQENAHLNIIPFENQSDDVPTTILPKIYVIDLKGHGGRFGSIQETFPHPILCSEFGVIDVLPDHMHEGECIAVRPPKGEKYLTSKFSFGSYANKEEYPINEFGEQPCPEIIANTSVSRGLKSTFVKGSDTNGKPIYVTDVPLAISEEFGTASVYNGHVANVGRVVTDSTFHHFFNINLDGTGSNSRNNITLKGFHASDEGEQHLLKINSYFCNIAKWLSRKENQYDYIFRTLWVARWDSQIKMLPSVLDKQVKSWNYHLYYGRSYTDILGRLVSPCTKLRVYWDLALAVEPPFRHPCPWDPKIFDNKKNPLILEKTFFDFQNVYLSIMATIMNNMVLDIKSKNEQYSKRIAESMPKVIQKSLKEGIQHVLVNYKNRLSASQQFYDKYSNSK
jgi:hypothetical protein